jgi:hypothetical protein
MVEYAEVTRQRALSLCRILSVLRIGGVHPINGAVNQNGQGKPGRWPVRGGRLSKGGGRFQPRQRGTAVQVAEPHRAPNKRQRAAPLSMEAWKQFVSVAKPYWLEGERKQAWFLLVLLIALMLVETQLAVMLNNQAGEMTSALAGKNGERFWT